MKKCLALLLFLSMVVCVFAGCGGKDTDTGEATINWVISNVQQKDQPMVWEKVNELLAEKLPDTKINFISEPSISSKWSLWMAGKQPIDLVNSQVQCSLPSEVLKGSFLELNDLIDKYAPTIKAEWEKYEYQYSTGALNGKLYAIPHIQMYINETTSLEVPASFISYLDVDALVKEAYENITTTDKMYQIIDKYLMTAVKSGKTNTTNIAQFIDVDTLYVMSQRGYTFIDSVFCYKTFSDDIKVVNFLETEEYKTFCKWARKWFEDGLISKDAITGNSGIGNRVALAKLRFWDMMEQDENHTKHYTGLSEEEGKDTYFISLQSEEQKALSHSVLGSLNTYTSIPFTSKNPVRTMKLLELLHTEEGADILNMICYGIEGKHYEKISDTEIKAFEYSTQGSSANSYGIPNWEVSSHIGHMYVINPYTARDKEQAIKYYDEIQPKYHKTKLYGMSFDLKVVANEIANVKSVITEYDKQIRTGVNADWEKRLNDALNKLKSAHCEDIIKNLQSQIDEYIK